MLSPAAAPFLPVNQCSSLLECHTITPKVNGKPWRCPTKLHGCCAGWPVYRPSLMPTSTHTTPATPSLTVPHKGTRFFQGATQCTLLPSARCCGRCFTAWMQQMLQLWLVASATGMAAAVSMPSAAAASAAAAAAASATPVAECAGADITLP